METVGEYEYRTKDLIGHGAFAVVYKGRIKKKPDSRVAIKCITKKNLSKSQSLLEKEICILKELTKLQHENVVALMDCKDTSHHVYLVMEYCNGGDLADYLHGKGTLSEDTIRLFVRQLAGAMKALYIKGIVHRDLKPQNILLSHEGKSNPSPQEIKLKIADFGFARFLQDGVMAATLCGSPMYMAPEVIMSLQYDAKADLWSLGTIVFQCLVGKAPFQANTPQALKMLYEKNANLAPKIPDGTSSELRDLLMRLLKRNAKDRLEFEEFFVHPFLQILHKTSSPVPVPSPGRKTSDCPSPYPGMTPIGSDTCSPKQFGISQSPPAGTVPRSPNMADISSSVKTKYSRDLQASQSGNDYHMTDDNDDFVIVPTNIPFDSDASACQKRSHPSFSSGSSGPSGRSSGGIGGSNIMEVGSQIGVPPESPSSRPSFLPVTTTSGNTVLESHPIPVPSQKAAFQQIQQTLGLDVRHDDLTNLNANTKDNDSRDMRRNKKRNSGNGNTDIECLSEKDNITSSPITMRRQSSICGPNISSLSPPSIQFTLNASPSSSRHRNTSGSSSGTPPPYLIPTTAQWPQGAATSSPIRCSGKMNPVFNFGPMFNCPGNPLTTNKVFDLADVLKHDPYSNINTAFSLSNHRVQTLPELMFEESAEESLRRCGTDSYLQNYLTKASSNSPPPGNLAGYRLRRASTLSGPPDLFGTSPPGMEGPITFIAPELPEETLLEKEHNETLAKLNFILALADCVMELAAARGTPISAMTSVSPSGQSQPPSMEQQLAEQVVLYFRALQLLSSALKLAKDELKAKRLQQTTSVKQVVRLLNHSYQSCLKECNDLKKHSLFKQAAQNPLLSATSADKLLYQHAIDMCQNAALDELLGNPHECCRRYQIAQILLHSLAQQVSQSSDQHLLLKYKEAVEKRLLVLQQQGFVYAYDTS